MTSNITYEYQIIVGNLYGCLYLGLMYSKYDYRGNRNTIGIKS